MNNKTIKELMYILIAITLGILAVKFVIWLLPIILIGLCSYYIYKSIKKSKHKDTKTSSKKKTIKIIDMEEDK